MTWIPTYPIDGYDVATRLSMNAIRCHDDFEVHLLAEEDLDPDEVTCPDDDRHAVSPMHVSETAQVGQDDIDLEFYSSGTRRYEYELEH